MDTQPSSAAAPTGPSGAPITPTPLPTGQAVKAARAAGAAHAAAGTTVDTPESIADAAENAGKRKQDPTYHVFLISEHDLAADPPRLLAQLLTDPGEPIHAGSRAKAIAQVSRPGALKEGEDERTDSYMVIRADELQILRRTLRRQTTVDESFE